MITKIIFIITILFSSSYAVVMQEGDFIKQKEELLNLKQELDDFYKEKEQSYKKEQAKLTELNNNIQKQLEDIEATKEENQKILDEINRKVQSEAMVLYDKMKVKIVYNILKKKIADGQIDEVFNIIIRLKQKKVMALMKKFDVQTSTKLMDMMSHYKKE